METHSNLTTCGFFITFEGIDGSGKSVQAQRLSDRLSQSGFEVSLIRDPGGPPISESIRSLLLDRTLHAMTPLTELFLYEAARSQLVFETILPRLRSGLIVICDRFFDSTSAYQGYGRSLPLDKILMINEMACRSLRPHRTYILDISTDESRRRRRSAGLIDDRMENQEDRFYRKVRDGYLNLGKQNPNRIMVLDGTKSISFLEQEILKDTLRCMDRLHPNHFIQKKTGREQ
ncbi:MAG TPA: dTMP kinase [bacterium]|nr:dTMP kinase [bacterium]